MIPKNKRHLIVNKEYSRLPYWTDDGYDDVQKSVSQKYIQDTYGAFAESENQLPYLSDADYQGLEYQYQNPEFFDPTDLPDVDFTDTVPKGTCYELWVDLFGNSTGAFIPTASQWNKLREYQKKCPLVYMPHYCCSSSTVTDSFVGVNGPVAHSVTNIKIHGPSTVKVNESAEYSVSGGLTGCAYEMDATNGNMIGSTFYAPSTAGSAEIFVKPWMSDDQDKRCDTKVVTITDEAVCKGTVHATTPQMQVGASQTLYITGGSEADTYYWSTTTGSLSALEGTSVTYTAPATNANCTSNPTITITCGGATIGTLTLAVNAYTGDYTAYSKGIPWYAAYCYDNGSGGCVHACDNAQTGYYNCNGTLRSSGSPTFACGGGGIAPCSSFPGGCGGIQEYYCTKCSSMEEAMAHIPLQDLRTAYYKSQGCCPAALL